MVMAQLSLNPELRIRGTMRISSTEEHPTQRSDIPASRYSGRYVGQLAYGARRIHEHYVNNAGGTTDRPPNFTQGEVRNGSPMSTSNTATRSAPTHTRGYQQAPGLLLALRNSWPVPRLQVSEQAPRLQVSEQAPRRVMNDDVWASSSWIHLARGPLDDRRGDPLRNCWQFPTSRSGISAQTVTPPEAPGPAIQDREQLGVKRFKASDGHRFEIDEQGRQARRVGSPHRVARRVPGSGVDVGRLLSRSGSSYLNSCSPPVRSNLGMPESARQSASAGLAQQDRSNQGINYCVRRDAHVDADTARKGGDVAWPWSATGSSYAPTWPFSAVAGMIDPGAGASGRERDFRTWGGRLGRDTCGSLCPCRGLFDNTGVSGDGAVPRHESLKVQPLSVDPERWGSSVAARGVNVSSETTNMSLNGGGEPANTGGYWGSDPRTLEASQDSAATGSRTGRVKASGERGFSSSMEGGGWAEAQARRIGGRSSTTSSPSSRCFTSRPTAALGASEPPLNASHTRIPKRKHGRGDDFESPVDVQIDEQGTEMEIEENSNRDDYSRRLVAHTRGYFNPVPLRSSPATEGCVKGAPRCDAAVGAVVRRFKSRGTVEGVPSEEAVPVSAVSALASEIAVEKASPQEGEELEEADDIECWDDSDDFSDASTDDAQEELSIWLHGTKDWWIY